MAARRSRAQATGVRQPRARASSPGRLGRFTVGSGTPVGLQRIEADRGSPRMPPAHDFAERSFGRARAITEWATAVDDEALAFVRGHAEALATAGARIGS